MGVSEISSAKVNSEVGVKILNKQRESDEDISKTLIESSESSSAKEPGKGEKVNVRA
jgi:hypothetical protein